MSARLTKVCITTIFQGYRLRSRNATSGALGFYKGGLSELILWVCSWEKRLAEPPTGILKADRASDPTWQPKLRLDAGWNWRRCHTALQMSLEWNIDLLFKKPWTLSE